MRRLDQNVEWAKTALRPCLSFEVGSRLSTLVGIVTETESYYHRNLVE